MRAVVPARAVLVLAAMLVTRRLAVFMAMIARGAVRVRRRGCGGLMVHCAVTEQSYSRLGHRTHHYYQRKNPGRQAHHSK